LTTPDLHYASISYALYSENHRVLQIITIFYTKHELFELFYVNKSSRGHSETILDYNALWDIIFVDWAQLPEERFPEQRVQCDAFPWQQWEPLQLIKFEANQYSFHAVNLQFYDALGGKHCIYMFLNSCVYSQRYSKRSVRVAVTVQTV